MHGCTLEEISNQYDSFELNRIPGEIRKDKLELKDFNDVEMKLRNLLSNCPKAEILTRIHELTTLKNHVKIQIR